MCGLAALINPNGGVTETSVRAMCDLVRHRGPDGEGYVSFAGDRVWRGDGPDTPAECRTSGAGDRPGAAQLAFGHRRLSIIDPTPAGHQPMTDRSERYWIIFNGEIYNYLELRPELEKLGHAFSTGTDTEVMLAAYAQWGAACLDRFNGMFAFVLYDRAQRRLFAARDRFGVKPLYWWRSPDGSLALASEIKQFTALPGWRARLDGQRTYEYLNWGLTDHTERTLFADVRQFPPGTYVEATLEQLAARNEPKRWYQLDGALQPNRADGAAKAWRSLFFDAVRLRLRADVPVGTALSGGLDSSSIVCAVHRLRQQSGVNAGQNGFSARSRDPQFDEGPYVDAVIKQTNVSAHSTWPDPDALLQTLPAHTWHMDEPFGSTSAFAEWCVFKTVRETPVKVTLDGHGADELLAGYTAFAGPHLAALARHGRLAAFLSESRALLGSGRHSAIELAAAVIDELAPTPLRMALRHYGGRMTARPDWIDLARLGAEPSEPLALNDARGEGVHALSVAQLKATSLPMQLHWNDRNSMAHSIESRAPFLDFRLVEFTLGLPDALKLAGGTTKVVLRQAMADVLPAKVAARRDKMGFVTPEQMWVTRDRPEQFRTLAHAGIDKGGSIFTPAARQRADDIVDGRRRFHGSLWRIISFGAWLERFNVAVN